MFALGVVLRLPTFSRPLLSDDEAIYAVTADAMSRGELLYRDIVDHKPPFIYHVYQAGFAALGRYNTHGAHALVILAVLVTAGLLLATAKGRNGDGGTAGIGLAAAGLFLIFSTTWHDYDALAANCELFLLAPQAAAAWLLLSVLRSPPRGRLASPAAHFGIGALIGISALFKVQGLSFLGASMGMLVWWRLHRRISWMRTLGMALCHLAGASLPAALYLAWCSAAGNAEAARFWLGFNFSYVGAGLTGLEALARGLRRTALIGGVALVPYALGIAAALTTARGMVRTLRRQSEAPQPSAVLGLLWLATSAVALCAGGRFFGHYFHLILPPLCLLAAPACRRGWHRGWSSRAPLLTLCALPALCFFALATVARPLATRWDGDEPRYEHVAAHIAALTAPDDRVFVWGNSMQLYVLARRPLGTRFSFCNYMTGESPGTPTETGGRNADANQLAAAWEMLFADLERRRPVLFVDAAAAGWDGYGRYPLARYPRLRAYVDEHYEPIGVRSGVVLLRRLRTR